MKKIAPKSRIIILLLCCTVFLLDGCFNVNLPVFKEEKSFFQVLPGTRLPFRNIKKDYGIAKGGAVAKIYNRNIGIVRAEKNGVNITMNANAYEQKKQSGAVHDLNGTRNISLWGKTIFLDPGHGVGAPGGTRYEDIMEYDVVMGYALLLKEGLEKKGATIVLTRSTREDVDNYKRMAFVNAYTLGSLITYYESSPHTDKLNKVIAELIYLKNEMLKVYDDPKLADDYFDSPYDRSKTKKITPVLKKIFEYQENPYFEKFLFISIHTNGEGNYGSYTYTMGNNTNPLYYNRYKQEEIDMLAKRLQIALVSGGNFVNRGIRRNDFFMLRESNIVAGLLEIAYLRDEQDREKLLNPKTRGKICDKLVLAIQSYFDNLN